MTISPNIHTIDIKDIWYCCRYKFLSGELSVKTTRTLLNKLHDVIVKEAAPTFTIDMYNLGGESDQNYYARNVKDYRESLLDLKNQVALEYFFNSTDCFEYDNSILITKDKPDYDYWFSLKLLQFEKHIFKINDFLEYTLQEDFKSNKHELITFLKLVIRQYGDEHLSNKIIETVNDFLHSNNRYSYRSNQKAEAKTANLKSYLLTDGLKRDLGKFMLILKELKEQGFVDKQTQINNFRAIFENKVIPENQRITWTGTYLELQLFIKILLEAKKIQALKNDIWLVTIKCFIKKDKSEFTSENLRGARGSKNRKSQLELIVSKF